MLSLRPKWGKRAFVRRVAKNAKLLDVGCGNNSSLMMKSVRPDIYYVGLDIGDYHESETAKSCADKYILTTPEEFDAAINGCGADTFDAVVSSHNLEHCNKPESVLLAMCRVLRPGGMLFLSFPSEASANFPSRHMTLNYHDDPTHNQSPPVWTDVLARLDEAGMEIVYATQRDHPIVPLLIGLVCEPYCALAKKNAPHGGTWALYGFQSLIWARKRQSQA